MDVLCFAEAAKVTLLLSDFWRHRVLQYVLFVLVLYTYGLRVQPHRQVRVCFGRRLRGNGQPQWRPNQLIAHAVCIGMCALASAIVRYYCEVLNTYLIELLFTTVVSAFAYDSFGGLALYVTLLVKARLQQVYHHDAIYCTVPSIQLLCVARGIQT